MENTDYLGKEKIGRLIMKFSIPCILSLLISALYNIVDQIFIGRSPVGTLGNTATTIVFPITVIALAFGLFLGDGAAAYMSLCMGRGEKDRLHHAVGSILTLSFIISMVFYVFFFPLLDKVLYFFGARTSESLASAHEYGFIIVIGFPFYIIMSAMNSIIRADGSPKMAMISMVAGAVTNIILDALMINVWNMGLYGAALATILGQVVSFVISAIYFFRPKTFRLSFSSFIPNFSVIKECARLGLSSFLTQIAIVLISVASMTTLAKYGAQSKYGINDPQAIVGVVMKVFTVVINIVVGIAVGAQPVIGYNYGARNYNRVRKAFFIVLASTAIVALIATLLFQTIPNQIVGIFGSNTADIDLYFEFGEKTVRIYLMLILFTCIQKVSSIFLQSISQPVTATLLSMLRDVIIFVPLTLLLPFSLGIDGVLWAAPISDTVSMIFVVLFLFLAFRKMKKEEIPFAKEKTPAEETSVN